MYWKRVISLFKTVTFRLTLWYTILFGVLSLVVFLLVYLSITSHLHDQTDNELLTTAEEFSTLYAEHGTEALDAEFQREASTRGIRRVFFRLLSKNGKLIASSDLTLWGGEDALSSQYIEFPGDRPVFRTISFPMHRHKARVVTVPTRDGHAIELGMTLRSTELMMERYRETFGTALAVMLVFGGIVGWLLSRKAMAGVQRVTHTAMLIKEGNLTRRVPLGGEGLEIDTLVHAFNDMLDRIEILLKELKDVTDNVAHDLRGPITRIRGIAETTLTGDADIDDFRDMDARIIEESDRLIEMINTMLEITQTEAGVEEIARETVDVQSIVKEAVDLFHPLAEKKDLAVRLDIPKQAVFVHGDRSRLQRAVANLLDNAIKYTPPGGGITVSMKIDTETVRVIIADTGTGIDPANHARIFERFFRGDSSRSTPGSGLGLSLARAVIRAHGGDIAVTSSPDTGSTFTITLPL